MFVESPRRRDSDFPTPLLEVDISCVGTPSVDERERLDLESAVWTSVVRIVATPSAAATHSGDPNDPGVASRTVNRAASQAGRLRGRHGCSTTEHE
jgi:hypothetical protein